MIENCDKYKKNAFYGTILAILIFLIISFYKYIVVNEFLKIIFIIFIILFCIGAIYLSMPYFWCLEKLNKMIK